MIKQIKPNSLSHKFLSLIFEPHEVRKGINICDVPWRLLSCGLGVCALLGLIVLGIFIPLCLLSVIWMIFFDASWIPEPLIGFGLIFYVCIVVFILLHWLEASLDWVFPTKDKPITPNKIKPEKPPSLLSIWWKSFKEKICVKVVVADNVEEK